MNPLTEKILRSAVLYSLLILLIVCAFRLLPMVDWWKALDNAYPLK